ncbi:ACT domain-containing protein, partial [Candidatus Margulisiibacteriota bacterium]
SLNVINGFLSKSKIKKPEDLYLLIGMGEIKTATILRYLKTYFKKDKGASTEELFRSIKGVSKQKPSKAGVKVLGVSNIDIRMAKCCSPLPGDEIIGFVTKGYGVSIHRQQCKNIENLASIDKARLIEVEWELGQKNVFYPVSLIVDAFDRVGLLQDIVNKIAETHTNIVSIKSKILSQGAVVRVELTIDIQDFEHLNNIKTMIKNLPDVYEIYRTFE